MVLPQLGGIRGKHCLGKFWTPLQAHLFVDVECVNMRTAGQQLCYFQAMSDLFTFCYLAECHSACIPVVLSFYHCSLLSILFSLPTFISAKFMLFWLQTGPRVQPPSHSTSLYCCFRHVFMYFKTSSPHISCLLGPIRTLIRIQLPTPLLPHRTHLMMPPLHSVVGNSCGLLSWAFAGGEMLQSLLVTVMRLWSVILPKKKLLSSCNKRLRKISISH